MMALTEITLLAKMETFNDDIREWRQKSTKLKMWETLKVLLHREQIILVTISRKGGYTIVV